MKNKSISLLSAFLCTALFVLAVSCSEDETVISSSGSSKSHNMGKNCLSCHRSGGSGEGIFTAAGTVYDSLNISTMKNGKINLYLSDMQTLVKSIPIDSKGNFYTTESIDLSKGIYAVIIADNGFRRQMPDSLSNGQCNNCHDGTTDRRIWMN